MEVTELNPYKTVSEILSLRSKVKSMKEKLTDLEEKLYMSFKDYVEGSKEKSFKLILKEFLDQFGLARDERRYVKTRLISAIRRHRPAGEGRYRLLDEFLETYNRGLEDEGE